ncbi:hypothetical protein [Actinoplanes sp. NPDC049265]
MTSDDRIPLAAHFAERFVFGGVLAAHFAERFVFGGVHRGPR